MVFRRTVQASEESGFPTEAAYAAPRRNPLGYVFSLRHARAMSRRLEEQRPDVVHLQNFYHFLSPSVLWAVRRYRRRGGTVRVVHTAHDFHLLCPNGNLQHYVRGERRLVPLEAGLRGWWARRYDQRSLAHSLLKTLQHGLGYRWLGLVGEIDVVISPSLHLARALRGRYPGTEVRVVRNPLPAVALQPPSAGPGAGARQSGEIRLGFVGRLSPEKGLVEFLRTMSRMPEDLAWTFEIVGEGEDRERIVRTARELGIEPRVRLRGAVAQEEVPSALSDVDVVVLPSRGSENAPLSIIEAAALGKPTLAHRLPGPAEMSGLVAAGATCDTDDPEEVARALRSLGGALGENRVHDLRQFSPEAYAAALAEIYRGLVPDVREER